MLAATTRSVSAAGADVVVREDVLSQPVAPAPYVTLNASPVNAPPPPLVMLTTCPPGLAPSSVLNETLAGSTAIVAAGPSVSVTTTVCGESDTPADSTGTVAV